MPRPRTPLYADIEAGATAFYRNVLHILSASGIPFLVGGAHALRHYTGIHRNTKDLDVFVRRTDLKPLRAVLREAGFRTEMTHRHWLAKVRASGHFIDLIFNSGNGLMEVDQEWFDNAVEGHALDVPVQLSPVEEMIWTKAFIMERERFDGADVAHLLHARVDTLDWPRLLRRFGPHWRMLLAHLTMFGFIYPAERARIPATLLGELIERLSHEAHAPPTEGRLCRGTLLSREQYLPDLEQGWSDARVAPLGSMTPDEIAAWTQAIPPAGNRPAG